MAGENDWGIPQTFQDHLQNTEKRLTRQERRPQAVVIGDLLGPGMSSRAVQILDWNSEEATFNGFFWSAAGSLNSPDAALEWTGQTIARDDGTGMQQVWNTDETTGTQYWVRTYVPVIGGTYLFTDWKRFATPSGYVDDTVLEPGLVDSIKFAEASNRTFRQPEPPVSDETYTLKVNDAWFDTDDDNHIYLWDGAAWVDARDALIADAEAAAAQAAADAAAATTAAANAQAAASAAQQAAENAVPTQVFRQPAKPTGGTYHNGDVWFDTDDGNRFYLYDETAADFIDGRDVLTQNSANQIAAWTYTGTTKIDGGDIQADTIGAGQISADAITAKFTITGATYQTDLAAARGVKITTAGLTAYDAAGAATLTIAAATGAITMKGGLTTGSTVDGAIITGGTLQTEATASRGVKVNSTGLTAYDASGTPTFTITASTGAVSMLGTLTSGSTISGATITGGVIQTSATNPAVRMSTSGLYLFDPSGGATLTMNAANGALTLKGAIQSGSTIDGAVVTGGTVQTEATVGRGIKMNSSGLTAYDASGNATLTISAATGDLTVTGKLQTSLSGRRVEISDKVIAGLGISTAMVAVITGNSMEDINYPSGLEARTVAGSLITRIRGPVVTDDAAHGQPELSLSNAYSGGLKQAILAAPDQVTLTVNGGTSEVKMTRTSMTITSPASLDLSLSTALIIKGTPRDAGSGAGLLGKLVIGDPTSTVEPHLRIDGNEIVAMATNNTQGTLNLNLAGFVQLPTGTFKTGVRTTPTLTANATNGPFAVAFSSPFPAAAPIPTVMLTPDAATPDAYVATRNVTRSGFDIYVRRTSTTALNVNWMAFSS